jgi:hypothetical protein
MQVRQALNELSTTPVYVPKRCTHFMQPLDICVNGIYKRALQRQWAAWYASEIPKEVTAKGHLKKPSQQVGVPAHTLPHT